MLDLLRAQIQQLQKEKDTALTQLRGIQSQGATNTGVLHQTAAQVQNVANASQQQTAAVVTDTAAKLDSIQQSVNNGFAKINPELARIVHNQRYLRDIGELRHDEYNKRFAHIEDYLRRNGMPPHSPHAVRP